MSVMSIVVAVDIVVVVVDVILVVVAVVDGIIVESKSIKNILKQKKF